MSDGAPRKPQVFDADDPALQEPAAAQATPELPVPRVPAADGTSMRRGIGWVGVLLGAMTGLASLAAGVWFANFVSLALMRQDWVGWLALGLLAVAGLAAVILAGREIVGLMRLGRLARLRRDAEAALRSRDVKAERAVVRRLRTVLAGRPEHAWAVARFREHEGDVRDAGELLALADRELVAPLDAEARRLTLTAAKRVSVVTAIAPMAVVAVGYVLVENLRLLRALATLYGGRPGWLGGLRLGRMVLVHLVATGGVALTDDLIGQFIGQDLVRRLSRRLGEGLFNGVLTARIGTAAIDVCRPIPTIEASPVRLREIVAELWRKPDGGRTAV